MYIVKLWTQRKKGAKKPQKKCEFINVGSKWTLQDISKQFMKM